jgi:hypothetical protein
VQKVTVASRPRRPKLRENERALEELRSRHYEETDQLQELQGALYAANADVQSLEQEINFLAENRRRMGAQLEAISREALEVERRIAEADAEREPLGPRSTRPRASIASARRSSPRRARRCPRRGRAQKAAAEVRATEGEMNAAEQEQGVHQARESHSLKLLSQIEARKNRLKQENMALVFPEPEKLAALEAQRAAMTARSPSSSATQHEPRRACPGSRSSAARDQRAAGSHARARRPRGLAQGAAGAAGAPRHRFEAQGLGPGPRPGARRAPLAGDPRRRGLGRRGRGGARRAPERGEARRRSSLAAAAARRAAGQLRGVRRARRRRAAAAART